MKKLPETTCRCRPLQEVCELAQTCVRFLAPVSQIKSTVLDLTTYPKVDGVCDFYMPTKKAKK